MIFNNTISKSSRIIKLFLFFLFLFKSDVYSRTISLRGNFHYLYMNMDEYHEYAKYISDDYTLRHTYPRYNNFHNGYGETIEVRFKIYKRFNFGLESGKIYGQVLNKGDVVIPNYISAIYQNNISLFSIPVNFSLYYYFLNKSKSKVYIGGGLGIWHSILKFNGFSDEINDYEIQFVNKIVKLKSNNISYCFQFGYEYLIFKKMGIDSKMYYRFANFSGFKGRLFYDINYYNRRSNKSNHGTYEDDAVLTYDKIYNYWGVRTSPSQANGHINMGNWGISIGLVWYIK